MHIANFCLQLCCEIRTKCRLSPDTKRSLRGRLTLPFDREQEKRARINALATIFCASSPRAPRAVSGITNALHSSSPFVKIVIPVIFYTVAAKSLVFE